MELNQTVSDLKIQIEIIKILNVGRSGNKKKIQNSIMDLDANFRNKIYEMKYLIGDTGNNRYNQSKKM